MTAPQSLMVHVTDPWGHVEAEPLVLNQHDGMLTLEVNGLSILCEADELHLVLHLLAADRQAA